MRKSTIICALFILASSALDAQDTILVADQKKVMVDSSLLYGFIPERPINVGEGPSAQRVFLESLRDAKGMRAKYTRLGSCCPHPSISPKAFTGYALLDQYEITYRDADNIQQKTILYLCFYEYSKPKAINGFTLVE